MLLCSRVVAAHMGSLGMDGEIDETSVLELKLGCVVGSFFSILYSFKSRKFDGETMILR